MAAPAPSKTGTLPAKKDSGAMPVKVSRPFGHGEGGVSAQHLWCHAGDLAQRALSLFMPIYNWK